MKASHKKVLLIIPSKIVARGLEAVLSELGEFRVEGILSDLSHASESRLRNMDADVIVIDPVVFDYISRMHVRSRMAEHSDAAVVALMTMPMDDEQIRQYDGIISMYDDPLAIVRKLQNPFLRMRICRSRRALTFPRGRRRYWSASQRVCSTRTLLSQQLCLTADSLLPLRK